MNKNRETLMKFISAQNQKVQDDISKQGYKDNSPYRNNPFNIIQGTPQGTSITMDDVSKRLYATDGQTSKILEPNSGTHFFSGPEVKEIALAKYGGLLNKTITCSNCGWEWKAADGGSDVMDCHKCGGKGLIKAQEGLTTTIKKNVEEEGLEYFNKVKDWYNSYTNSPGYLENLKKSGYKDPQAIIDRRLANISNTGFRHDENRLGTYYNNRANRIHYSPIKDQINFPGDDIDTTLAHEVGHSSVDIADGFLQGFKPNYNKYDFDQLIKRKRKKIKYAADADENYADQKAIQYEAEKQGLYKAGYDEFTEEIFDKLKDSGFKERALKHYSKEDLIWLLNNIAQNDNQSSLPIAQEGLQIEEGTETQKQNVEDARKYMEEYMDSPMYKEMLRNSLGVQEDYENMLQRRNKNFNSTEVSFPKKNDPLFPNTLATSNSFDGKIEMFPRYKGPTKYDNTYIHELSHSVDRPYRENLDKLTFEEFMKERPRLIPAKDIDLMDAYRKATTSYHNLYEGKNLNNWKFNEARDRNEYISDPTETRARLNELRYMGKKNNIYDPFTQKVTPEIFKKLGRKSFFEHLTDVDGIPALDDLREIYTDDQIINLLNTVSQNDKRDEQSPIAFAQWGGVGQNLTSKDSVNVMGQKHVDLEHLIGYPGGNPNPTASMTGSRGLGIVRDYVKNKGYGSAMNQAQINSWLYNAGFNFDKKEQTINPKKFILGEYYRKHTPYKKDDWDINWGWKKRQTISDSEADKLYSETVSKLPEQEQQILTNLAKDWFYKNRAGSTPNYGINPDGSLKRDKYGAWSPDYEKIWAPFTINQYKFGNYNGAPTLTSKNEIDYNEYYRNQTVPKSKREDGGSIKGQSFLEKAQKGVEKKSRPSYKDFLASIQKDKAVDYKERPEQIVIESTKTVRPKTPKKLTKQQAKIVQKDLYEDPFKPEGITSGDKTVDFLYNNEWLMDVPILGSYIKDKAKEVATNSGGATTVDNVNQKLKSTEYTVDPVGYTGNLGLNKNVTLLDQYFSEDPLLHKSKYKPTSDYLEFLPSYSVKGDFDKDADKIAQLNDLLFSTQNSKYKEFLKNKKPIYLGEDTGIEDIIGVDLGGHKTGIGWDDKMNLPYMSVSDAWDFEPSHYSQKWMGDNGFKSEEDNQNDRNKAFIQSYLMHKAGNPFKIYDRFYFDPETRKYISDNKIQKRQVGGNVYPVNYVPQAQDTANLNTPENWEKSIRNIEHQIGNPNEWSIDNYRQLQKQVNEYKFWRENTPEGKTVYDSHNEPNEYVVPLPNHLKIYKPLNMLEEVTPRYQVGGEKKSINVKSAIEAAERLKQLKQNFNVKIKYQQGGLTKYQTKGEVQDNSNVYNNYTSSLQSKLSSLVGTTFTPNLKETQDEGMETLNCIGGSCNASIKSGVNIPLITGNDFWDQAERKKIPFMVYANPKNKGDYGEALDYAKPGDFIGYSLYDGKTDYLPAHTNIFVNRFEKDGEEYIRTLDAYGEKGYHYKDYKVSELVKGGPYGKLWLGRPTRINGKNLTVKDLGLTKYFNDYSYAKEVSEDVLNNLKPLRFTLNKDFVKKNNLTPDQVQQAAQIINIASTRKRDIIKNTGMSEKTYDMLAQSLPGIVFNETRLGDTGIARNIYEFAKTTATKFSKEGASEGPFQIRHKMMFKNPQTRKVLETLGITSDNYDSSNLGQQTVMAMVLFDNIEKTSLKDFDKPKTIKYPAFSIEAARARGYNPDTITPEQLKSIQHEFVTSKRNNKDLSLFEKLIYLYNAPSIVSKGEAQGDLEYAKVAKNFLNMYAPKKQLGGTYTVSGEPLIIPSQGSYPFDHNKNLPVNEAGMPYITDKDGKKVLLSSAMKVPTKDEFGKQLTRNQIAYNQDRWNDQKEAYSPGQADFNAWKNNEKNTKQGYYDTKEYDDMVKKFNKLPAVGLEGLQIGKANKRGKVKGSCPTGDSMGGDSLRDNNRYGGLIKYQNAGKVKYGTPEYEQAYNRGEVITEDGQQSPILLDEVVIQREPTEFGKVRNEIKKQNTWEDYAQRYLGNFERRMGQTLQNLPEYRKREYEDYINKLSFDEYVKTHPQAKGEDRGAYIDRIQAENAKSPNFGRAYEANAPYNDATDINKWRKFLVGLGSITVPKRAMDYMKQHSDYYSTKEKQEMEDSPILTTVGDVMGTLEPLTIPVEGLYSRDKSFGDIASGESADIPMSMRILGDPLMPLFEAAPLLMQGYKGLRAASTLAKTLPEESALAKLGALRETSTPVQNIVQEAAVAKPWQMEELPGLHIKSTMANNPKGLHTQVAKDGTINTENALKFIKNNEGEDKYNFVLEALGENIPKKMDYNDFMKTIQDNIIPLEQQLSIKNSDFGIYNIGYTPKIQGTAFDRFSAFMNTPLNELFGKPKLLENKTIIFGNANKFGKGSSAHGNPAETLGHIHYIIDAKTPNTITSTQIQADALQGTHSIMPKSIEEAMIKLDDAKAFKKDAYETFGDEPEKWKDVLDKADQTLNLEEYHVKNLSQKFLLEKNHQERLLQDFVDYAGKRGDINNVRVPTSETAAKIQNYTKDSKYELESKLANLEYRFSNSRDNIIIYNDNNGGRYIKDADGNYTYERMFGSSNSRTIPEDEFNNAVKGANDEIGRLKESLKNHTPDYTEKQKTILKKYSEQPKTIKKLFGVEPKLVKDAKGNTWYEFDIPESFKQGKGQIKAFNQGGELPKAQFGLPIAGTIANMITSWFSDDEKKPVIRPIPVERTFHIKDPRTIRATTQQPIRPTADLLSGTYNSVPLDKTLREAKRRGLNKNDMWNLAGMALAETGLGNKSYNIGQVVAGPFEEGTPGPYEFVDAYISKMKEADRLGIKDPVMRLQVYNGLGPITPDTEKSSRGYKMQKAYGVPLPKEGISMRKRPLYGINVLDAQNNVLKKNPEFVRYIDSIYKAPVHKQGGATTKQQDPLSWFMS